MKLIKFPELSEHEKSVRRIVRQEAEIKDQFLLIKKQKERIPKK